LFRRLMFVFFRFFALLAYWLTGLYQKENTSNISKRELLFSLTGRSHLASIFLKKLIVYGKAHERKVSEALSKIKGQIFVDVGANVGYYPLFLSQNFKKIYAFEPFKKSFRKLCRNLYEHDIRNAKAIMKAVSDTDGEELLVQTDYGPYHRLVSGKQLPRAPKLVSSIPVETVTLATFFPNTIIDLIKVDVEGAEWRVLKGAEPILKNIKRWVIELHDPKQKRKLEEWFFSHGYSFRWLDFKGKTANHIYAWRA